MVQIFSGHKKEREKTENKLEYDKSDRQTIRPN